MGIGTTVLLLFVIYCLIFLVPLYLVRRFNHDNSADDGASGGRRDPRASSPPPDPAPSVSPISAASEVVCSTCGVRNDSTFTFCRNCAVELPSSDDGWLNLVVV